MVQSSIALMACGWIISTDRVQPFNNYSSFQRDGNKPVLYGGDVQFAFINGSILEDGRFAVASWCKCRTCWWLFCFQMSALKYVWQLLIGSCIRRRVLWQNAVQGIMFTQLHSKHGLDKYIDTYRIRKMSGCICIKTNNKAHCYVGICVFCGYCYLGNMFDFSCDMVSKSTVASSVAL